MKAINSYNETDRYSPLKPTHVGITQQQPVRIASRKTAKSCKPPQSWAHYSLLGPVTWNKESNSDYDRAQREGPREQQSQQQLTRLHHVGIGERDLDEVRIDELHHVAQYDVALQQEGTSAKT